MSTEDNSGPAFPTDSEHQSGPSTYRYSGMTLRDYFAAMAMQAVATNPTGAESFTFDDRAKWAYQQADAMLKARAA